MSKAWTIAHFMLNMAFFGGMGIGLFIWSIIFFMSLTGGYIIFGFLYGLFYAIGFATVGFLIGLLIGLMLGALTTVMSPITQHNETPYRLAMFFMSIIVTFVIGVFSLEEVLKGFSATGETSLEFLLFLSGGLALILGFASQYLASQYLKDARQEKPKNI